MSSKTHPISCFVSLMKAIRIGVIIAVCETIIIMMIDQTYFHILLGCIRPNGTS